MQNKYRRSLFILVFLCLAARCAALKYRARKSVYKRDSLRLRHKKKLQRCCSEALPFTVFGIATFVGIVYFFVEDMRQPGFDTGDSVVHALYYTIVTSTTIGTSKCVAAVNLVRACTDETVTQSTLGMDGWMDCCTT